MSVLPPISTEEHICRDCYKCLRQCPLKAISFHDGRARVDRERCVWCGHCVSVCPVGAKQARSDMGKVAYLLAGGTPVIASLAPSWVGDFPDMDANRMVAAIKQLGFAAVSETAVGAEYVSAQVAEILTATNGGGLVVSSACPAVVEYCNKYQRQYSLSPGMITPLTSPLLAHCRLLKESFNGDCVIVFIGPCIAKKREADDNPELLAAAITFNDLRRMWENAVIDPLNSNVTESVDKPQERQGAKYGKQLPFLLGKAGRGSLYPYEGGMIESVMEKSALLTGGTITDNKTMSGEKKSADSSQVTDENRSFQSARGFVSMSFSGLKATTAALRETPEHMAGRKVFLELLACDGGCVNGPGCGLAGQTVRKRLAVLANQGADFRLAPVASRFDHHWSGRALVSNSFSHSQISSALRRIGKNSIDDELNCGGCGYNCCRDFAQAFLEGKAEETMCVSYMRHLAQEKANALVDKMPSAVVIVDDTLTIIESNYNFATLIGGDARIIWQASPQLVGVRLDKLIPFGDIFSQVLRSGIDVQNYKVDHNGKVLAGNIFVIQKNHVVGAIFHDITASWVNWDTIIKNTRSMISRNLETVQKIAYLLGENAADNEALLNSIIESFYSGSGVQQQGKIDDKQ